MTYVTVAVAARPHSPFSFGPYTLCVDVGAHQEPHMQGTKREVLLATLAAATAEGLIAGNPASGRLMSPEETRSAMRGRTGLESSFEGWWACSDVHPDMHATFGTAACDIPAALTQVQMGSDIECLVLLHQIDRWQHRFCIPLVGETIARWLDSMRTGAPLQLSLAAENSSLAMVSKLVLPKSSASQLPHPPRQLPTDIDAFVDDFLALSLWSALRGGMDAVPNLPAPERICVSLMMPPEIQAFAQALAHRQGNPTWFEC